MWRQCVAVSCVASLVGYGGKLSQAAQAQPAAAAPAAVQSPATPRSSSKTTPADKPASPGNPTLEFRAVYRTWKSMQSQGDVRGALPHAEQARALAVKNYGPKHAHTARTLSELAELYFQLGDYVKSAEVGALALATCEQAHGKDSVSFALAEFTLGRGDQMMRDYSSAIRRMEASLKTLRAKDPKHPNLPMVLRELSFAYAEDGKTEKGCETAKEAFELSKVIHGAEHKETAIAQARLGFAEKTFGNMTQAENHLRAASGLIAKRLGDKHPELGLALYHLSWLYSDWERFDRSEEYLLQAGAIFEQRLGRESILHSYVLNDLGNLRRHQSRLRDAEKLYLESMAIRQKLLGESHAQMVVAYCNLAIIYSEQGDKAKARLLFEKGLQIAEQCHGNNHEKTADPCFNLGVCLLQLGDLAAGTAMLKRSVEIFESTLGEAHPDTVRCRSALALLYAAVGKAADSEALFARAVKTAEARIGLGHPVMIRLLHDHAVALLVGRRIDEALALYERAAVTAAKEFGPDHPSVAAALLGQAECHARKGAWKTAMTVADKARRMHRKFAVTILPGLSEEEQLQFINERRLKDGVNALSLASAANSTPEMISLTAEWLLNLKSLRSAVLADRARISRSAGSPELRKLVDELVLQRAKLAALMLHPDTKKDAKSLVDDLFSLQRSVDELNRSISKFDAKGDSETKWADIDSIRKAIPAKSILVEFGRMDRCDYSKPASELPRAEYGAWIIPAAGGGDIKFFNLGSATYVELAVIHARRHLAQSMANADVKSSEAAARKALTPLSQTLLRPLAAAISDAEKVIISPDGALWMVPWPALIDSDNNYLIEKYSVSLVGTGRDLLNKAPTKGISTGVIVADPDYDVGTTDAAAAKPFRRLPGTAREAKEVALHLKKIAGGDPTVLMGAAASEVAVKELHNVSVLVLSTHGFYLPIPASAKLNPLLCCGLALKGANHRGLVSTDDDGILTGMEVVGINLEGTKLVVLSACDTGVGQLQVGEGVAGLRQAFQLAGAEAVVASLWPVADEETATLMGRFFKHQATSRQYADALRQAQLEFMDSLKRERGAAHPILWAAFSVMSATP